MLLDPGAHVPISPPWQRVLPAELSKLFHLSLLTLSCESPLFFGGIPTCPCHQCGRPGLREPAAAMTCWHSHGAGDGDKVTSPTLCLHRASSSVCHGLCMTCFSNFCLLIQPKSCSSAGFSERRKGREGEAREDVFLHSFFSPSSCVLPLLPTSDLLPHCSCPSLHPHSKVMLV